MTLYLCKFQIADISFGIFYQLHIMKFLARHKILCSVNCMSFRFGLHSYCHTINNQFDIIMVAAPKHFVLYDQPAMIECIGNSITCGAGSDMSVVPCGTGKWHDQHNAYMSYAAIMSRSLNAQSHLSAVSGIGLMHSCCNMNIIMPQVYDKISMRNDSIQWDFKNYQPDLVTICLGQNDGIQDSAAFCNNYISFLKTLRNYYPKSTFILLSSPMANEKLRNFMKATITAVQRSMNSGGDKKVYSYIFTKQYSSGCDYHPSLDEHKLIAKELTTFIRKIMNW